MLSRALSLATVTLLIGCLTAAAVRAQENLDAGKSPAQIFAGTCNACHKSPRGLLRTVPASSLPGFLRQHYTTGGNMASVLSAYLVANGATDNRPQKDAKGKDGAKDGTKEAARAPADAKQQFARFSAGLNVPLDLHSLPIINDGDLKSLLARIHREELVRNVETVQLQIPRCSS